MAKTGNSWTEAEMIGAKGKRKGQLDYFPERVLRSLPDLPVSTGLYTNTDSGIDAGTQRCLLRTAVSMNELPFDTNLIPISHPKGVSKWQWYRSRVQFVENPLINYGVVR